MQVKGKHKYGRQNLILTHQPGCSCVLKRPPTLPMRKNTHFIEKCFGNPPPSLFSPLVFYREEPGTGKWGQMVHKFPGIPLKARQTEYLERYINFFPKTFQQDEPLNSPRNYKRSQRRPETVSRDRTGTQGISPAEQNGGSSGCNVDVLVLIFYYTGKECRKLSFIRFCLI